MQKSYRLMCGGDDVVARWHAGVGAWPSGWVLLERGSFVALFRAAVGSLLPVHAAAAVVGCDPERIRTQVRGGSVRGFAYPVGHNWVCWQDVLDVCGSK